MIAVINYGLGNLLSVVKAFEKVAGGRKVKVTSDPTDLKHAEYIVLPGVGNFRVGIENLINLGLADHLEQEVLEKKTPFLGICLGMQLMAETGEEDGKQRGLGWIPGKVRKLDAKGLKVPHLGWDDIELVRDCHLFSESENGKDYYFVHSYVFDCPEQFVVAYCNYGERFPVAVQKDNLYGTQFHPEKSRELGLNILSNFIRGKKCSKFEWFLSSF